MPKYLTTALLIMLLFSFSAFAEEGKNEPIYEGKTLSEWIKQLETGTVQERWTAVCNMERIGDQRFVPCLVAALKDADSGIRWGALKALKHILDTSAIPAIIESLNDEVEKVREEAAHTLGEFCEDAATEPLIKALSDKSELVREAAAEALGEIGDMRAIPALINALHDEDYTVRRLACDSLVALGISSVPALIKALKDEDKYVRLYAALALGRIGDRNTMPALKDALNDEEAKVRYEVIEALGSVGDKSILPILKKIVRGDDREACCAAIDTMGKIGDKSVIPLLYKALIEDRGTRWNASEALIKFGKVVVPKVIKISRKYPDTRPYTAIILANIYDISVLPELINLIEEKDKNTKRNALEGLKIISGQRFPDDNPEKWREWWNKNKSKIKHNKHKEKVRLSIVVDSNDIVPFEPLCVTLALQNISTEPITVEVSFLGYGGAFYLAYEDRPYFQLWASGWRDLGFGGRSYKTLQPGEICASEQIIGGSFDFDRPGSYMLKAKVGLGKENGMARSAPVKIVVRKPSQKEAEAGRIIIKKWALWSIMRYPDTLIGRGFMKKLIVEFPDTAFADHAKYALMKYYLYQSEYFDEKNAAKLALETWDNISNRYNGRIKLRALIELARHTRLKSGNFDRNKILKELRDREETAKSIKLHGEIEKMREKLYRLIPLLINSLGKESDPKGEALDKNMAAAETLRNLTGQSFGNDPAKWQEWWEANKDRILKEEAEKEKAKKEKAGKEK